MIRVSGKFAVSALRALFLYAALALALLLVSPAWADDTPTFITDLAGHCSVGTYHPEPGLTVRWSGSCVGGKADGSGVVEWQANGVFTSRTEGQYRNGLRDGRAISTGKDGARTEAEYRAGRMNGRCIVTLQDGSRFDGQCVNDQYNGPGKEEFKDGGHFEGDFKDSKITGKGVRVFADGSRLEGDFADGILNGKGRGIYLNGYSYEGDFVNGKYEGTGTYHFADGGVYEGEWHNGIPNGRGVYHGIPNGPFGMRRDFAGTWVDGCFAQAPLTAALFKKRAACGFDD